MTKKQVESVYTFSDNTGTFKVIDGELHFLDCFSKEYEAFCIDYKDVLNDDQIKTLKEKLGDFTMYKTHGSWGNPSSFVYDRDCNDCGAKTCAEVVFFHDDKVFCEDCCPEGYGE